MSEAIKPHLHLTPRVRRLIAAAALVIGALVVGRMLLPWVPREVDVRVRLDAFREAPQRARALDVSFERRGSVVRALSVRFQDAPPAEWRRRLSLPPGDYEVMVRVEIDGRVLTRESNVHVEPGAVLDLPAPRLD